MDGRKECIIQSERSRAVGEYGKNSQHAPTRNRTRTSSYAADALPLSYRDWLSSIIIIIKFESTEGKIIKWKEREQSIRRNGKNSNNNNNYYYHYFYWGMLFLLGIHSQNGVLNLHQLQLVIEMTFRLSCPSLRQVYWRTHKEKVVFLYCLWGILGCAGVRWDVKFCSFSELLLESVLWEFG